MNLRGFKIKKAVFVFLALIILGLGTAYILEQVQVTGPLENRLADLPGVEKVDLVKTPFGRLLKTRVRLKIREDLPLALVFSQIEQTLEEFEGEFVIQLEDSPNTELWNVFQGIQVPMEEAIMTGRFMLLEQEVKARAEEHSVDWALALDRNNVYLVLKNDEGVLQQVIARGQEEGKIKVWTERAASNEKLD